NKIALVIGGARMGSVIAQELAKKGVCVVLSYRSSRAAAQKTVEDIKSQGGQAFALKADVTREGGVKSLLREVDESFKALDILINMASIYSPVKWSKLD